MEERYTQQREKVEVQEVGQRATPNLILQHGGSEHKCLLLAVMSNSAATSENILEAHPTVKHRVAI